MWRREPSKREIEIQGIPIVFIRSDKAKRVNLVVNTQGVRVSVPRSGNFNKAKAFVLLKIEWIKQSLVKIEKRRPEQTVFKLDTLFRTRSHQLKIMQADIKTPKGLITHDAIEVQVPINTSIENQYVQQFIRKCIDAALRREAKEYLPIRLQQLANQFGLIYNKLSFRNPKARWGSCSNQNNISLNIQLMCLPDHLIDYVILHELAHTEFKNHSKDFWIFLEGICPSAKALDKEMKQYQTQVF